MLFLFDSVHFFFLDNRLSDNQYDLDVKDPVPTLDFPLRGKPDIYYIFFDELMGTDAVKEYLDYDNSALDSALVKKGFFVASKSKSAYSETPFSIASGFQSSVFINKKKRNIHLMDYLIAYKEIQQNPIIPYLRNQGYSIRNFAHYKLFTGESAAMFKDPSYDTRQIVTNQTFSSLIGLLIHGVMKDRFPNLIRNSEEDKSHIKFSQQSVSYKKEEILRTSIKESKEPLFVHGHFFVPHLPVLFDSLGRALGYEQVKFYQSDDQLIPSYKMNLAYCRILITQMVDEIMKNTNNQAVIIIQSDHGFRKVNKKSDSPEYKYSNFTAIYYPDRNYKSLREDFFLPNTFRYFINKYSDTTIRLTNPETIQLSSKFLDD